MISAGHLVDGQGLGKTFGEQRALAPLDLKIASGERVALAGPSGSGKSTLLYILAGLVSPDCGQLFLNSLAVSQLRPGRELSEAVGLIQQQFDLVPQLPVVQNVLAGRLGQWGLFRSLASLFSPRERVLALEALSRLGIDDKIDQRTGQLSGGEQQRVNIARTLIQDYPVLLLDEPTASLDEKNRNAVIELINQARNRGTAIVGIFHDEYVRESVGTKIFNVELAKKAA